MQGDGDDVYPVKWRFFGHDLRPDYTFYIYPAHVWATNQILLTRKGVPGYILQRNGLLSGLFAYSTNFILNNWELFGDPDAEYEDPRGKYWFYLTVGLWNPLNILVVRTQCVEFPMRFSRALADMVKVDGLRMFYRGFFPIFTGQVQLWFFMQLAFLAEGRTHPAVCGGLFLMGCAAAHPWYLAGMRVQYARFHPTPIQREAYSNTFKAILYVKETQGVAALWRGFVPALLIYSATYY